MKPFRKLVSQVFETPILWRNQASKTQDWLLTWRYFLRLEFHRIRRIWRRKKKIWNWRRKEDEVTHRGRRRTVPTRIKRTRRRKKPMEEHEEPKHKKERNLQKKNQENIRTNKNREEEQTRWRKRRIRRTEIEY